MASGTVAAELGSGGSSRSSSSLIFGPLPGSAASGVNQAGWFVTAFKSLIASRDSDGHQVAAQKNSPRHGARAVVGTVTRR